MGSNKGGFQWQNWNLRTGYKLMQWRSTVAAPLCGFCKKTVYPAEEVMAAGQKFHKFCLKCISCNTFLNSGNLSEHEKKIYCIACHRRQFGPRGRTLSSFTTDTPPSSPSSNHTEKSVDNEHYGRKTSISSSLSRTSSDDDSHFSNPTIHPIKHITERSIQPISSRPSLRNLIPFKMLPVSKNICPRCSKTVYLAEEIKAVGKSFHKQCYTCANCRGSINGGQYSEHEGELYDNNCYRRLFGPKGTRN